VIAVSQAVANHLDSSGVDPARLVVAPDGIDCRRLSPRRVLPGVLRRELGVDDSTPLVLCVGQLGPRKGQDVFLAAAEVVARRDLQPQFVVVGTRLTEKPEVVDFEAALHRRASNGSLADRTHFLGWRTDVPELLRDADVVVNAARQEPLGVVILEAMSLARPLVATAVGGTGEQIEHGRSGLLVAPDEPLALAEAVLRLLADASLRQALGRAARQTIEQRFDVEQAAARVERLQRDCLKAPGG
jgi:glycosyltransferase involved in cell wall biosynthesis